MSTAKTGLDALLTPQSSVLVLIDHQPFQFANLHSHEPTMIVNNVVGLAKAAKGFNVPTILTTVTAERGGHLIKPVQDVFPDQQSDQPDHCSTRGEDSRVVDAVKERPGSLAADLRGAVDRDLPDVSRDPQPGRWLRRVLRHRRVGRNEP